MTEKQIKYLEEKGLIKTIDDAPTDDWPEDFLEKCCVIGENIIPQSEYNVGDIVFVKKYKYKDGKIGFNHLFVVIETPYYLMPFEYACMHAYFIQNRKKNIQDKLFCTKILC